MAQPMVNPQLNYLKTQIETASQPQLLLMLFDAAVRKLNIAKKAMLKKDIETTHTELTKVQSIFAELMVALDVDLGGDVAKQLLRLYDFVYHHLVQANIKQDPTKIDEVMPIVENLRDSWRQAVAQYNQDPEAAQAAVQQSMAKGKSEKPLATEPMPTREPSTINPIPASAVTQPTNSKPTAPASANYRNTGTYGIAPVPNPQQQERPRLNIRG